MMSASPETAIRPITDAVEAARVISALDRTIAALTEVLELEGLAVRAGKLSEVARLSELKNEHARAYLTDSQRLKESLPRLRDALGGVLDGVKARHAVFQVKLQQNLTALATAHAVSEGIIRGVAGEMTRTAAPQVYGASGRTTVPPRNYAGPIAVSRSL